MSIKQFILIGRLGNVKVGEVFQQRKQQTHGEKRKWSHAGPTQGKRPCRPCKWTQAYINQEYRDTGSDYLKYDLKGRHRFQVGISC